MSDGLFVAGIGTSAGGLESLERFFRNVSPSSGVAYVVVQHLSADHKSLMEELIRRFAAIPVVDARDGMELSRNHIYVLSPGTEIEIQGSRLAVFERDTARALAFPIDRMLSSLADSLGPKAIAIILSGSGSDGTRGIKKVDAAGGLVLVEDPATATFDGMPRSAIDSGAVQAVMSAEALPQAIAEHIDSGALPDADDLSAVEGIVTLLQQGRRADFDEYKRGTIYRRGLRRAQLAGSVSLTEYVSRLRADENELAELHDDLLIGVTSFFRNPEAFAALSVELDSLVKSPVEPDRELRAWCAGCATGEEAYSIAILLDEAIRRNHSTRAFKVFATDLHPGALDKAGTAVYAKDRLTAVDAARKDRYFSERSDGTFQIVPSLRNRVVFANHDLLKDTPFTNLDVVSCRNLLIYFKIPAQRRALASLSYGLRIGGSFLLGSSESLGEIGAHFDTVSEACRLYRKRVHSRDMHRPQLPTRVARVSVLGDARPEASLLPIYDAILETVMPIAFLVGSQRLLLDTYGGASRLLEMPERRPTGDFIELLPYSARSTMAGLLLRAQRNNEAVSTWIVWAREGQNSKNFLAKVTPIVPRNGQACLLVSLEEQNDAAVSAPKLVAENVGLESERAAHLERELSFTRLTLQSTVEELETSNEELQATNEELVASNEELQSVNEELHSVNEELHTVNAEHQHKITELTELNRDIGHLLDSIDVATVYLDRNLKIRKYTPRAGMIFGLVAHDIGRQIAGFNHQLHYATFMDDVMHVRDHAVRIEKEVRSRDERWYFVRLLPYRVNSEIAGVVVSLIDATVLAEAKVRARQLSDLVDSNADAIIGMSLDGTIQTWNEAATRVYGYTSEEAQGKSIMMLVPMSEQSAMKRLMEQIRSGGEHVNIATTRIAKSGKVLDIAKTMSPVRDGQGIVVGLATIDRDIHDQIELERRLRESEARYEDLYHHAPDLYLTVDLRSGRILEVNETFLRLTGFHKDGLASMHVLDLFPDSSQDAARRFLAEIRGGTFVHDVAVQISLPNGRQLDADLSASAVYAPDGTVVGARVVMRDASARRLSELEVARSARMREQFLAMVSHELRGPLHAIAAAFQIIDQPNVAADAMKRSQAVVRRQYQQMARLVDDLLDVSRITHGKLHLQRAPLDLGDVARSALDAIAPAFHKRGVILSTSGFDVALPMFGDAGRLSQVLANLLSNALRYTPNGRRVRVTCDVDANTCSINVADEGRGIASEDLESIFDMFRQARQGLARSEGGLGLGLTIAERIVTAHGGTISARSDGLNRGATFIVKLVLDGRASNVEPALNKVDDTLSIVLVEDQVDPREMMVELLTLEGHRVKSAGDGEEGLALILSERPQVALLDIGLPKLSGYEVAQKVREALGKEIIIVALSGYGQPEDLRAAEVAGFDSHLTKPIDLQRLRGLLRNVGQRG